MKILLSLALFLSTATSFASDVYVHGYTRSNGTHVQGYHRSSPDNTVNNNYGTVGNVNPYTGNSGTQPYNYGQAPGAYNAGNGLGQ